MIVNDEWSNWNSGDCLCAKDGAIHLSIKDILNRLAPEFRFFVADWDEGDRWVEARIRKASELGFRGFLMDAEVALRGNSVLVTIGEGSKPESARVQFYVTPDTGAIDLHYSKLVNKDQCREVVERMATLLNYDLDSL